MSVGREMEPSVGFYLFGPEMLNLYTAGPLGAGGDFLTYG